MEASQKACQNRPATGATVLALGHQESRRLESPVVLQPVPPAGVPSPPSCFFLRKDVFPIRQSGRSRFGAGGTWVCLQVEEPPKWVGFLLASLSIRARMGTTKPFADLFFRFLHWLLFAYSLPSSNPDCEFHSGPAGRA